MLSSSEGKLSAEFDRINRNFHFHSLKSQITKVEEWQFVWLESDPVTEIVLKPEQ